MFLAYKVTSSFAHSSILHILHTCEAIKKAKGETTMLYTKPGPEVPAGPYGVRSYMKNSAGVGRIISVAVMINWSSAKSS